MKRNLLTCPRVAIGLGLVTCLSVPVSAEPSLEQTMDGIVARFYATLDEKALSSLSHKTVLNRITDAERKVLATKYWYFEVNVPVVVSVIRNVNQPVVPFWIEETGFKKTDLVVRKRSFPPGIRLTEQSKQMFFLASYNIDKFRQFVFESSFLKRYDIDRETREKIGSDEIALLKFGLQWLKWLLFKEGNFKLKKFATE